MTERPGEPSGPLPGKAAGTTDPRDLDLFGFARAARQAAGRVCISQLPRMLNEVPSDVLAEAPARDTSFAWQAEGALRQELQDDGTHRPQPYLRLAVHGSAWLVCQRCLAPYEHAFDVDATFRIVGTEDEANASPLDDDDIDVIVGSRHFDLVDLVEEELLLSLPLVPKHEVCPGVHASLVSGADGSRGVDSVDDLDEDGFAAGFASDFASSEDEPDVGPDPAGPNPSNPFAALGRLRNNGSGEPH